MAQIDNVKRIRKEDFAEDQHELVDQLAFILNRFMQQVADAFNGQIDLTKMTQTTADVTITVDSTGKPLTTTSFLVTGNASIIGLNVINASNTVTSTNYPTSQPFISYTPQAGFNKVSVVIDNISGLVANEQYKLKILVIK